MVTTIYRRCRSTCASRIPSHPTHGPAASLTLSCKTTGPCRSASMRLLHQPEPTRTLRLPSLRPRLPRLRVPPPPPPTGSLLDVPTTICTAQLQPRSILCFISLIKYLNLAGLLAASNPRHILDSFLRLDIPITQAAHSRGPNHHLHVSTSSQISSLFYLSD